MASFRIIEFHGFKLCLNDQTYEPAEDTELLLNIIKVNKNEKVIDLGSGTGILGIYALKLGARVIFIDINPYATLSTLCSLKINDINSYSYEVINCNLLTCFRDYTFDVVIFNPPYLPFEEYSEWIGYSWSGGKGGIEVIGKFLQQVKARRIYTLYSSLSDEDTIWDMLKERRYIATKKYEKVIGYERLVALELIKYD
ncbi:HemK2/MTQ2 family protein methyltransferase [Saccharolobus caldissimus]|uniref:Methyltransferase n=1 Tax=Saccharolobus caldissimus TaxID=1702097 RepID=A0AAQ4CPF3_9CREN|nr:HemK2/MTQ2 family protein methyltransferase [Saccharolobus caldissimus]BDB97684.1 methyltransferase [Saccharolobus caldissimus]